MNAIQSPHQKCKKKIPSECTGLGKKASSASVATRITKKVNSWITIDMDVNETFLSESHSDEDERAAEAKIQSEREEVARAESMHEQKQAEECDKHGYSSSEDVNFDEDAEREREEQYWIDFGW